MPRQAVQPAAMPPTRRRGRRGRGGAETQHSGVSVQHAAFSESGQAGPLPGARHGPHRPPSPSYGAERPHAPPSSQRPRRHPLPRAPSRTGQPLARLAARPDRRTTPGATAHGVGRRVEVLRRAVAAQQPDPSVNDHRRTRRQCPQAALLRRSQRGFRHACASDLQCFRRTKSRGRPPVRVPSPHPEPRRTATRDRVTIQVASRRAR